jgi:UDP-3-O-[3-hydroxymyristoyl] glucosamine N-acyltransferase
VSGQAPSEVSYTVAELAHRLKGELRGDGTRLITGINTVEAAGPTEITFIMSSEFLRIWGKSKAGAAVISRKLDAELALLSNDRPLIIARDAEIDSISLLELFCKPEPVPELGPHPTSVIHSTVKLGKGVRIGPHVSIDAHAAIGDDVVLHAGVRIYESVEIGAGTVIHANTVIRHRCRIGRGVIMHQGVSIGADGFGYRPDPNGAGLMKMPHLGNVVIEDSVEIGANSCIDRAKFGSTRIGAGTKIDNQVQIAHNCTIGRCCIIAGCVGMSGSVSVGDGALIAGAVGITDHIKVGAGAKVGAMSLVMQDVPAGATYLGHPADPAQSVLRQWASVRKLPGLLRRLTKSSEGDQQQLRGPHRQA